MASSMAYSRAAHLRMAVLPAVLTWRKPWMLRKPPPLHDFSLRRASPLSVGAEFLGERPGWSKTLGDSERAFSGARCPRGNARCCPSPRGYRASAIPPALGGFAGRLLTDRSTTSTPGGALLRVSRGGGGGGGSSGGGGGEGVSCGGGAGA